MSFNAYNISFRRDSFVSSKSSHSPAQDGAPKSSPLPPPGPSTERGNPFDDLMSNPFQRSESPGGSSRGSDTRGSPGQRGPAMEEAEWHRRMQEQQNNRRGSLGPDVVPRPSSANKSRLSFAAMEGTKNSLADAFSNFSFPSSSRSNASTPSPNHSFLNRRPSVPDAAYHPQPPPMDHRSSVPNIIISGGGYRSDSANSSVGIGSSEKYPGKIASKQSRLSMRVGAAKDLFTPSASGSMSGSGIESLRGSKAWPSGFVGGTRGPQPSSSSENQQGRPPSRSTRDPRDASASPASEQDILYRLPVPPKVNLQPAHGQRATAQMIENLTANKKDAVLCSGEGSFALPSPVYRTLRGEQGGYDSPTSSSFGSPTSASGGTDWLSNASPARSDKLSPNYKGPSARTQQQHPSPQSGSPSPSSSSERYASKKLPTPPTSPSALYESIEQKPSPSPHHPSYEQSKPSPLISKPTPSPVAQDFDPELAPPHCIAEEALANHQLDETFLSLYQIRDELGSGGFGFVCSAWSVVERCEVAVKFIYKSRLHHKAYVRDWHRRQSAVGILPGTYGAEHSTGMRSIPMEAALLQYCHHPGIVSFVALYEDKTFFYLVQELHGSPWSKTQLFTVEDVSFVTGPSTIGLSASTSGLEAVPELAASSSTSTFASSPSQASLPDMVQSIALLTPSLSGKSVTDMHIGIGQGFDNAALQQKPSLMDANEEAGLLARPGMMKRRSSHDLFERIETQERFSDGEARYVFAQIVDAVAYLHRNGIVHRDIKDENIVIDDDLTVKIIDFGSAVIYDARREPPYYTRFYGTINFASSEIVQAYPYQAAPAEVWSLGVLLAILLTGVAPYDGPQNATTGQHRIKNGDRIHPDAIDLIKKCLELDPVRRLTIEHVKRHRWLVGSGVERVSERASLSGKEDLMAAKNPTGFRPITQEAMPPRSSSRSTGR